uniref:Cnidarian restricted protein n=1 Tax=Clytia hemisphaerica TaxID=252671 RepID=A0A7M5U388_9CNID
MKMLHQPITITLLIIITMKVGGAPRAQKNVQNTREYNYDTCKGVIEDYHPFIFGAGCPGSTIVKYWICPNYCYQDAFDVEKKTMVDTLHRCVPDTSVPVKTMCNGSVVFEYLKVLTCKCTVYDRNKFYG